MKVPIQILAGIAAVAFSCATVAPSTVAVGPPADPSGDWDLRWDREFAGWEPAMFEGKLHLERDDSTWKGQLSFQQSVARFALEQLKIDGDRVEMRFRTDQDKEPLVLLGWVRGERLVAEAQWGRLGWTPMGGRRARSARLREGSVGHSLAHGDVSQLGLDDKALKALLAEAERQNSSAVVIIKDGKVIVEKYRDGFDGGPLVAMSASKSIVNLAIGQLIGSGRLSLETKVSTIFEEWKDGPKAAITIRQLLTHTSGLDPARTDWEKETIREHALASPLVFKPGSRLQYNNNAVDFLAAIVARVAGASLDTYLDEGLFKKLDIVDSSWMKDREGTPRAAGELMIRPVDLAKIGQLMLQNGQWNGEQLLTREWVAESTRPGQSYSEDCGLLWWREGKFAKLLSPTVLEAWKDSGIEDSVLANARPLASAKFAERAEFMVALEKVLGAAAFGKLKSTLAKGDHIPWYSTQADGPSWGFSARGWLGQYLVVIPEARLVAVRMRAPVKSDYSGQGEEKDGYRAFAQDVWALVAPPKP